MSRRKKRKGLKGFGIFLMILGLLLALGSVSLLSSFAVGAMLGGAVLIVVGALLFA